MNLHLLHISKKKERKETKNERLKPKLKEITSRDRFGVL